MTSRPQARMPACPDARKRAALVVAGLLAAGAVGACGTDAREEAITTYLQAAPDCGEEAAREGYGAVVDQMGRTEDEFVVRIIELERAEGCTPLDVPEFELTQVEAEGDASRYDVRFSEDVGDHYALGSDFKRCFEGLYDQPDDRFTRFQLVTVETDEGPKVDLALSKAPECA